MNGLFSLEIHFNGKSRKLVRLTTPFEGDRFGFRYDGLPLQDNPVVNEKYCFEDGAGDSLIRRAWLPGSRFMRVRRSFIIQFSKIEAI